MTCTVTCLINASGTHTVPKGTRPNKPVRWEVAAWLLRPDGNKSTHTITVHSALMFELVPAVNERITALIEECGDLVVSAGWTAHGRGPAKRRRH